MYKTVLVGIDGSESSLNAFNVALEMAKKFGSKLLIVTTESLPFKAEMKRKAYRLSLFQLLLKMDNWKLWLPLSTWMRDWQPLKQVEMWGALTPLNALQMTDVTPNRCREPMNRPREALALQRRRRSVGSIADYVVKNAHCSVHVVR